MDRKPLTRRDVLRLTLEARDRVDAMLDEPLAIPAAREQRQPLSRRARQALVDAFFTKYPADLSTTPEGELMTDGWRVTHHRDEFGVTMVRTTMVRQRKRALRKLRR